MRLTTNNNLVQTEIKPGVDTVRSGIDRPEGREGVVATYRTGDAIKDVIEVNEDTRDQGLILVLREGEDAPAIRRGSASSLVLTAAAYAASIPVAATIITGAMLLI